MENKCKLGIMQPYFFPYLGYFQLINAVDKYVVYDDVNFIKGGRINRNLILVGGEAKQINLLLKGASPNKHINEIELLHDSVAESKTLKTIEMNYSKAPYYDSAFPIIEKIFVNPEKNLGIYLFDSIKTLCGFMNINTEIILSSSVNKDNSLKAEEKVYEICRLMNAKEYYNSIGGQKLYDRNEFSKRNIKLYFLKLNDSFEYMQFGGKFIPNLSIIDVMMFNSVEMIQQLLTQYTLL